MTQNNPKEKLCKVAFVGAGYMIAEHIKAFQNISNVELSGIYSRTKSRAESLAKEFGISIVANSISELYNETNASVVVVGVPELSTFAVVKETFEFPWIHLIEKPVGYNFQEAHSIIELAQKNKTKAFVALNRRHYSSTVSALNELKNIEGKRFIHVQDQEDLISAKLSGQPEKVLENWMYANSIHLIDYFKIFGRGEIVDVQPIFSWNPNEPDFVSAKIKFSSGDLGLYQAVWNCPGPWIVSVTTREKRIEMRPLEQTSVQLNGQRKLDPIPVDEVDQKFKPGLRRQAQMVVNAFWGAENDLPTLEEAFETMRLVKGIYQLT
ncbi:gfo/Idh/MocA family oxidoreductase [Leptospira kmetyi]|uniref:Gfo/Idh/MocA family oxidoreductase n=1 Tax=Leptospira kmetyi TaxID=408139 RepID=A0AAD0URQ5_9LEPT|nr:Gfo/Idh/MocA family oxidoreductase [Leptospira kmetyi]AYV57212.1 gfo/Idh/MocA family oxidoreductase [Leptospira kmetyi]TGL68281.1 gfo/Idh/MocA family oxidoreductase [Leptospira kmetyi]